MCENCGEVNSSSSEECGQAAVCGHCDEVCLIPDILTPRHILADYCLVQELAQGEYRWFKARQFSVDRIVYVYVLTDSNDEERIHDFINEGRKQDVLEIGNDDGIYYFVCQPVRDRLICMINEFKDVEILNHLNAALDLLDNG